MIYILLYTLFFGVSDVLWKPIIKKYDYSSDVLSRTIITSLVLIIFVFLFGNATLSWGHNYLLIILFGRLTSLCLYLFGKIFRNGSYFVTDYLKFCYINCNTNYFVLDINLPNWYSILFRKLFIVFWLIIIIR